MRVRGFGIWGNGVMGDHLKYPSKPKWSSMRCGKCGVMSLQVEGMEL
jgi:hypothetical protein